jgi:L,D-transpeptidase ErfK/SrfK
MLFNSRLRTQGAKPRCLRLGGRKKFSFLIFLFCLFAVGIQNAYAIDIYNEIYNNQEEYQLKKGEHLSNLAQRRALRLQVLARQINAKKLKPGSLVNLSYAFILPAELTDGLVVNLAELTVYYFQNGVFISRYSLAAGRRDWETPTGTYKILSKEKNPTWHVPNSIQWEMYDRGQEVITEVPPGPKNPLGGYFILTSAEGVGFHATTSPWTVGRYASHGCFRMLPDQVAELFKLIDVGTKVKIIYKPIKLAATPDNRILLEIHGDYYGRVPNYLQAVQSLAKNQQLEDRIDWQRVKQVIKARDGIAVEVTQNTAEVNKGATSATSREVKKGVSAAASETNKSATSAAASTEIGSSLYSGEIVHKPLDTVTTPVQRHDLKKKPQSGS